MGSKFKSGKKSSPAPQNGASAAPQKAISEKKSFKFPSNVKQIGGLHRGIKIYIEDYAYSFINRLGAEKGDTSVFLAGFKTTELGEDILVISGAISPPGAKPGGNQQKGEEAFSENDWKYAKTIIEKYFKGLEIVGWARVQPGYGLYLSSGDINSHYIGFTDKHSVLFVCDPEEKLDCFYEWNENQDDLEEVSGYFVYYDKNNEMSAYAAESHSVVTVEAEIENAGEDPREMSGEPSDEEETITLRELRERFGGGKKDPDDDDSQDDFAADGLQKSIDNAKRIAEIQRQKRIIRMMTSISGLLFFACVVMGFGLMQSGERISLVETQLRELRNGYNSIVSRLNDSAFPAFASQTSNNQSGGGSSNTVFYIEDAEKNIIPHEADATEASAQTKKTDNGTDSNLDSELGISVVEKAENSSENAAVSSGEVTEASAQSGVAQKTTESAASSSVYFVQPGDTLTHISQKFYGNTENIDAIIGANGITDPDKLIVGSKLIIP